MRLLAKPHGKNRQLCKNATKTVESGKQTVRQIPKNKLVNGVGYRIRHFLALLLLFEAVVFNNKSSTII